jgi:hypothetical protein
MITKSKHILFTTSDGQEHRTIEDAQKHVLALIFSAVTPETSAASIAAIAVLERDKIIDCLTTGPRSLAKARKVNGGTKKRTPKVAAASPTERQVAA